MFIGGTTLVTVVLHGEVIEEAEWPTERALQIDLMTLTMVQGRSYRVIACNFDLMSDPPRLRIVVVPGPREPADLPSRESTDREQERRAVRDLVLDRAEQQGDLTSEEVTRVRDHMAEVGFDPSARTRAGGRLQNLLINGQPISTATSLPVGVAHYVRHAIIGEEWPPSTTSAQYFASLKEVIRNPRGGIFLDQLLGTWELTFVAPSGDWRGPNGSDWIIVGYRVNYGYWVTGFQPRDGLEYLTQDPGRLHQRWLVYPEE